MTAELFAPFFLSPPDKKKSSVFAKKWTICQKVEDFRQKIVEFSPKNRRFSPLSVFAKNGRFAKKSIFATERCLLKMDDLPKSQ
jgi:hypothetical protein